MKRKGGTDDSSLEKQLKSVVNLANISVLREQQLIQEWPV
jgi:hypothetical protein